MKDYLSLKLAYLLATAEGEGLGTAYEYVVKQHFIKKVISQSLSPKSILVAGLPEKYGFSLDFVQLAQHIHAEITMVDEREEKLRDLDQILSRLKGQGLFPKLHLAMVPIADWSTITLDKRFDLVISCEVLQRLGRTERAVYMQRLGEISSLSIFFAPNAGNAAHARISKLHTLSLGELKRLAKETGHGLLAYGYIDMPPFPPGLNQPKREGSRVGFTPVFNSLTVWATLEKFAPRAILKRQSHIVCIAGRRM